MNKLPAASLEYWMREFYHDCTIDLGSSGVETYTLGEVKQMLGFELALMNDIKFDDSLTIGSLGLRKAIAEQFGDGDPNKVMTSNGSNEMLYHIMSSLLESGDEVVCVDPVYHALDTVAQAVGCKIKRWVLRAEVGFTPSIDDLKALLTDNTKMVIVNFPHNPTGASITSAQQKELLDTVAEVDAYLVWDGAFNDLVDGESLPNPSLLYNKAISVGTLSKGFGLPGLRIGWCFAPQKVIDACVDLRDYTTLYISPLVEFIGERVIAGADILLAPRLKSAQANRAKLAKWLEDNEQSFIWPKSFGGVTCFIKFKQINNVERFCRDLAKATGVMLVPGTCFNYDEFVRLGFGCSEAEFDRGLVLLTDFINQYKEN